MENHEAPPMSHPSLCHRLFSRRLNSIYQGKYFLIIETKVCKYQKEEGKDREEFIDGSPDSQIGCNGLHTLSLTNDKKEKEDVKLKIGGSKRITIYISHCTDDFGLKIRVIKIDEMHDDVVCCHQS
jgi:hypothetical protein